MLVGDNDIAGYPLALRSKENPAMPSQVAGTYMCNACVSNNKKFYNHEFKTCQSCSKRHDGCKKCNRDSFEDDTINCTSCETGYEKAGGTCINCQKFDSNCLTCTTSKCSSCKPNYWHTEWGDGTCVANGGLW